MSVVGRLAERWKAWEEIGANPVVLNWVRNGVHLIVNGQVEEDCRSFTLTSEQTEWLRVEIQRLVAVKAIAWVGKGERPQCIKCVSPVFLVPKTGPKKWRLVIDNRRLNAMMVDQTCKFEGIDQIIRNLGRGWWFITWDLAQGYHHVQMTKESAMWLGFQVGEDWYVYLVIPFGMKWSPFIFTKVVRPMIRQWRRMGLLTTSYVDDFSLTHKEKETLIMQRDNCITPLMDKLGWVREETKGCWEPTQQGEILGWWIDTVLGTISLPERKVLKILKVMKKVCKSSTMTKRELSQVAGLVQSTQKAFAPARLFCREWYNLIKNSPGGWKQQVQLTARAKEDALWIHTHLRDFNGRPLWTPSLVIPLNFDAMPEGWGAFCMGQEARGDFQPWETEEHICILETKAVKLGLESFVDVVKGKTVELRIDNKTTRAVLEKGGSKKRPELTELVREIWFWAIQNQVVFHTFKWVKGVTDNVEADRASRKKDFADWMLKRDTFLALDRLWGPHTIDRMADNINRQVERFNSRWRCPETEAVNTFTQNWEGENNWVVPPFAMIHSVLRHVWECQAEATVIIPHWESQPWWPLLLQLMTDRIVLARGCQCFQEGRSGFVEPWKNPTWEYWAVRLQGKKLDSQHWQT